MLPVHRHEAVKTACAQLPVAVREALEAIRWRVVTDKLPLLTMLSASPLEIQSAHLSFQVGSTLMYTYMHTYIIHMHLSFQVGSTLMYTYMHTYIIHAPLLSGGLYTQHTYIIHICTSPFRWALHSAYIHHTHMHLSFQVGSTLHTYIIHTYIHAYIHHTRTSAFRWALHSAYIHHTHMHTGALHYTALSLCTYPSP